MEPMGTRRSWRWQLLPVLLVGVAGVAGWLWRANVRLTSELDLARTEVTSLLQRSIAAEKQAQQSRFLEEEVARLKRETEEIHRLRGQFQELQQLKTERENLQRQIAQLQGSQQTLANSLRAAQQSAPPPTSWIGVAMNVRSAGGVEVQSVVPGGPAANSGLDAGDVITAVDGRAVANPQALRDIVAGKAVGQDVLLDVLREGSTFRLSLKTGAFPR